MERAYMSTDKVKDTWDSNSFRLEGDPSSGLTWPPKNYSCSFCKREFRSAQALGGHMNVHRRDRARLRQLSSWVFECSNHKSNSNPNPNFSPQHSSSSLSPLSPSVQFLPHSHTHISFVSRSLSKASNEEKKPMMECPRLNQVSPQCGELEKMKSKRSAVPGVGEVKSSYAKKCEVEALKKGESISLDLEMGFKGPKEALDLELRLGYL